MPDLILIRFHPAKPMAGVDFTAFLAGLTITAFDLTFGDSATGVQIGTAAGLADPHLGDPTDDSVDVTVTSLLQHYRDITLPIVGEIRHLEAAATAVIVVNLPPDHHEYPSPTAFDLRLRITRGGLEILDRTLEYNIRVETVVGALSTDQTDYFGMEASAFFPLPSATAGLDPALGYVELPANGQPPDFDALVTAINKVLALDPEGTTLLASAPLTAAQSRQVAAEIVWNRQLYPAPELPTGRTLGDLYTHPPIDTGLDPQELERDRMMFEGEIASYRGTREAEAMRLAGFVFAASAAVACEAMSTAANRAGLAFPLITPNPNPTGFPSAIVILTNVGGVNPAFTVPAAYFYALGANLPPQVTAQQRFEMAKRQSKARLLDDFQTAIDAGVITPPIGPAPNTHQAARRLRALGAASGPGYEVPVAPPITALVTNWLAHAGLSASIDADFWTPSSGLADYLELVLRVATGNHLPLVTAVQGPPHNVASVAGFAAITDQQWRDFFLGNPVPPPPGAPPRIPLLPPFTLPGTAAERVEAFLRHLQKLFALPIVGAGGLAGAGGAPPSLPPPLSDIFAAFEAAYLVHAGAAFAFGGVWNEAALHLAVSDVLPGDPDAQNWLMQALRAIDALFRLTALGPAFDELRFSLMEALYARGFTSAADVKRWTLDQFREALIGTVAYEHAAAIYALAPGAPPAPEPPDAGFVPINPDGLLTDCIPPPHLSPFGPVHYLHEMLKVAASSTCEAPLREADPSRLELLLAGRRGQLGNLQATRANLEIPLPVIDLVNESLEFLVELLPAGATGGVVYDTAADVLAGHRLAPIGRPVPTGEPYHHDPGTLFEALPEHSSPAVPVGSPGAYDALKADFTAPLLPYSQPLDVCRTYLKQLGTGRYAVMRRFRKEITEFVLAPNPEPVEFQNHLWRYPVRIDVAREYLGISPETHALIFAQDPPAAGLLLRELYGFPADAVGGTPWMDVVVRLPEFLRRTGLTYCEFIELWRAEFVRFIRAGRINVFPICEPCCLDGLAIQFVDPADPAEALKRLAVFIRLWRLLQQVPGARYSFAQLRDVCNVLKLYQGGAINPEFIRQLAAFQILRDHFDLALTDGTEPAPGATGADRTHILSLWVDPKPARWDWAIDELLDQVQRDAQARHKCGCREPQFIKLLTDNLKSLSALAGFDPAQAGRDWDSLPTHTLRFAEVLSKIYASRFGVGELLFLFTPDPHLGGDDPFPEQPPNEAVDSPLDLPDDTTAFSLWSLRDRLLEAEVGEAEAETWTWSRIVAVLREELGYTPPAGTDPLLDLGRHYFPSAVEAAGTAVATLDRQYRVPLAGTSAAMWNTPLDGPFRYDAAAQELWTQLPLSDEAVILKLSRIRQLNPAEQTAVGNLYFRPRTDLARFAFLFENFGEAEERLIQEPDEARRWGYFQSQFALCYRRCRLIAEHLAGHVTHATGQSSDEQSGVAWSVLRHLFADENRSAPGTSWESDAGQAPAVTWPDQPAGSAFAALLGLTGTGLPGEFTPEGGPVAWRELRGPLDAFGPEENAANTPIPTVIPRMGLTLTNEQLLFVAIRNGFTLTNPEGIPLGGAQGFTVRWDGVLLVEKEGEYEFRAGDPTAEGVAPDFDAACERGWFVTLQRGQRTWAVLSHQWPDQTAPAHCSSPLQLRRGAYHLTVQFRQPQPAFDSRDDVRPQRGGFQLKYSGPDTDGSLATVPHKRLFQQSKTGTLADRIDLLAPAAQSFLTVRYTSSLRDIRRTYLRAFKAVLFAHRLELSAKPAADDGQSELGYLLAHAADFAGRSYYDPGGGFVVHRAFFDFNLLPVRDNYFPPSAAQDARVSPSHQRRQALFDWWERLFDYTTMRREAQRAPEAPAWFVFHEAAEAHPDPPVQLLRHLGVDLRHGPRLLRYFLAFDVTSADLEDERWVVRVWQGEKWFRALAARFFERDVRFALPDLWASDDPGQLFPLPDATNTSGNANLTRFYRDGCIENGEPRRYEEIERLNDWLRGRARAALLAYLCGMDRVPLPFGVNPFAQVPRDLSDLLLQDVEAGRCQKASRIEEAISAVQAFIQRARLGLEPGFVVTPAFAQLWDRRFATFTIWELCKRRETYRENWVDWDELELAGKTEAFRFLQSELRRSTLTVPVSGGLEWWPDQRPPAHPSLLPLQWRDPSQIRLLPAPPVPEGLGLLGTPERDARPSWLAPVVREAPPRDDDRGDDDDVPDAITAVALPTSTPDEGEPASAHAMIVDSRVPADLLQRLPLWIQAAIRLGARFIRVAAAGIPPASTPFMPRIPERVTGCCAECGHVHPPVMDEYYFWLQDSGYFDAVVQDADAGVDPLMPGTDPANWDPTSDWHREDQLPGLLHWEAGPTVHLFWCRVHNGEFQQPRRSDEGLRIDVAKLLGGTPQLDYMGRTGDSLRFEVVSGPLNVGLAPPGYLDPTPPGFRYDLTTDSAVVLPLVAAPPAPPAPVFAPQLAAYPFFAYFAPGAHLLPPSLFSVGLSVAGALRAHCRFEAALHWYELAFHPLRHDNTWMQCPRPQPPPDPDNPPDTPGILTHQPPGATGGGLLALSITHRHPMGGDYEPCCPTAPVDAATARERAVTLHYLETLLQWGDALMCRNSPEAFQQATVLFNTMHRILGARPVTVFAEDTAPQPMSLAAFQPRPAALNPRLVVLYGRAADRLALIHHCLNDHRLRNGRPNLDMPYWGNRPLRDGWQTTHSCQDEDEWCLTCCSAYRFEFLIQKALELAVEVRGHGAELLAAYEKGDTEYLASLRATHERQLAHLGLEVRQNQWREADWQVQALQKTKEATQTRQRYYETLIQNGLNTGEVGYEALTGVSIASRAAGNISEGIAQGMGLVPDVWSGVAGFAGTPLFFTQLPVGNKLAAGFATAARILNALAEIAISSGGLSLTEGGWERREEEWEHQVEVLKIEIQQIERQILAAERRRDVAQRELNIHQRQIENAVEFQNYLRDKFTSHQLYLFLQQETAALHYQVYELARYTARKAERAFNYERGHTARRFLPEDAWDTLHEGLMAGERLQLALRQMERAYLDANCREYELTKHISLRLHFPMAFLQLKVTGYGEIEIPEWMFDLDYPGHYMRRIKNVTLSIPCVAGPYTGVHCRLTLLSSSTRVDPRLDDPPARCCDREAEWDGYRALPDDPRIVSAYAATAAIATSSGQSDSGMFELLFRDERYLPFEFAGAVSRWRIELPPENNFFDFDSLGDVVLHLNYTAREGGDVLRRAANTVAQRNLLGGLRIFDVKHEFPDAWHRFQCTPAGRKTPRQLDLSLGRDHFPFLPGNRELWIKRLEVFVEAPGAEPSAHRTIEFLAGRRNGFSRGDHCPCDARDIHCIARVEWPGLYHGVLESRLGPLSPNGHYDLATFRFPLDMEVVSRVFLFCRYEVACIQAASGAPSRCYGLPHG